MTTESVVSKARRRGKLFAFEGPDGAGKSTIVGLVAERMRASGPVTVFALPGRGEGTLGLHIYKLHHQPEAFGVGAMSSAAKQLLHVAAHADVVETSIRPRLEAGETILLDRFWWSMWVYGTADGMSPVMLDALVRCEHAAWGEVRPDALFLITRSDSLREADAGEAWRGRQGLYIELAEREQANQVVFRVANEGPVEAAVGRILQLASHEAE